METVSGVGAAGAGVAAAVVVMAAGAAARLATEKLKGPPATLVETFCTTTVAGMGVLVRTQVMRAACLTLEAGTVSTLPLKLPKLAGLPVKLELASVQDAAVAVKRAFTFSVITTSAFAADDWIAVGVVGVAVLATVVEMAAGADAKLLDVNVNGPPTELTVVFCSATVGNFGTLVNVQRILAKVRKFTTGIVMTLPASVPKLAGFPDVAAFVSIQLPVETLKLVFAASVIVTAVVMLVTET